MLHADLQPISYLGVLPGPLSHHWPELNTPADKNKARSRKQANKYAMMEVRCFKKKTAKTAAEPLSTPLQNARHLFSSFFYKTGIWIS